MSRMIDQVRASKLPSNMMQFAARGALAVPAAESIEIMVYLARHNKVFGDLARMTLAGWDEKSSLEAASDPNTPREVLDYLVSPDNLRPKLLPALLENPSVSETELVKFARSATRDAVEMMLQSPRIRASMEVLGSLRSNPYLKAIELDEVKKLLSPALPGPAPVATAIEVSASQETSPRIDASTPAMPTQSDLPEAAVDSPDEGPDAVSEEVVSAYLTEHAAEVAADADKPFQAIGTIELLGANYFPVSAEGEIGSAADSTPPAVASTGDTTAAASGAAAKAAPLKKATVTGRKQPPPADGKRENSLQKISRLDVKGRIQLALKGNKEERSLLIRDGTKVVALAVLEAPKLSDGEVEKFALQKNVLEAVLRQIPLKRRFMKNYIVVRNLVANPRTPLDLGLGLMKHLLPLDLKNISGNKEISETVRKLALKMYKQKLDAANKK